MRTIVTGGAGFIGSNIVDALLERGDEVTIARRPLDRQAREHRAARSSAARSWSSSTSATPRRSPTAVEAARPEAIFHLAAQIDVRKSVADPAFDARTNVEGTINVLRAARGRRRTRRQQLDRRRDLRRGPDPPGARGPSGRAQGALRPVEVLRRALLRPVHAPARRLDRLAALRQRLRPAPGPARRGRRDRDLLRPPARGHPTDRLRRRPRRRATTSTSATSSTRTCARPTSAVGGVDQHRHRRADERDRHRRGARRAGAPGTSPPSTATRARARCSTSRSTPAARRPSSAGRRGSGSSAGSSGRSPRCASPARCGEIVRKDDARRPFG